MGAFVKPRLLLSKKECIGVLWLNATNDLLEKMLELEGVAKPQI